MTIFADHLQLRFVQAIRLRDPESAPVYFERHCFPVFEDGAASLMLMKSEETERLKKITELYKFLIYFQKM